MENQNVRFGFKLYSGGNSTERRFVSCESVEAAKEFLVQVAGGLKHSRSVDAQILVDGVVVEIKPKNNLNWRAA